MTNFSIIESKISSVEKYLNQARSYQKYTKEEIQKSPDLSGAVERYLYLVVQSCIDLAESLVSLKNFRKPATYRESFQILAEQQILSCEIVESMMKMTGFRNIIAHDYERVDYSKIHDILQHRLVDIEEFVSEIKNYLKLR